MPWVGLLRIAEGAETVVAMGGKREGASCKY